jgi:hypothetical protein
MKLLKELSTLGLGIIAIIAALAIGWLLFAGIYHFGNYVNVLFHWEPVDGCASVDDELLCQATTWLVGFVSLMVVPILWCAGTILRWIIRKSR